MTAAVWPKRPRRPALAAHVAGLTAAIAGVGIAISGIVEFIDGGPDAAVLLVFGAMLSIIGAAAWSSTTVPARIRRADVFFVVTAAWVTLAVVGAFPYLLTGTLTRVDDALFEAVSGFTTTGATVLRPVESQSAGILLWRSITQWLGGMGVIVLVVAVLPTVSAGGMELLDAESPGPTGDRLRPKVRETAQRLWAVYVGLTGATALGFAIAGMSAFDAVSHSFTTVSTGGFSTYNRSIAHFESAAIEWVAIVAMFLAGGSFASYYRLLRGRAGSLLRSVEFRAYCALILGTSTFVWISEADAMGHGHDGARGAMFSVVSIVTTTGYATVDFASWSEAAQVMVLLLLPVGAMAGSTAGGVKLVRVLAVGSVARRELARQLHPRLVRPVRVGARVLDETVTNRVLGFLVLALAIFGTGMFAVSLTGEDLVTAFSASASAFGNVGPGLGAVGPTTDFLELSAPARGVLQAVMLLGRLEIYPVLLALFAIGGRVPIPRQPNMR